MGPDLLVGVAKYVGGFGALVGGTLAIWKAYTKWSFDTKSHRQKELKVVERFLANLNATTPDFAVERWYFTIFSDRKLQAREIRYLLLFSSPTKAFGWYRSARRYLEVLGDHSDGSLEFAYKEKFAKPKRQAVEHYLGHAFFFIFMAAAVVIFPLSGVTAARMLREGGVWWLELLIAPVWFVAYFSMALAALEMGMARDNARLLIRIEQQERPANKVLPQQDSGRKRTKPQKPRVGKAGREDRASDDLPTKDKVIVEG